MTVIFSQLYRQDHSTSLSSLPTHDIVSSNRMELEVSRALNNFHVQVLRADNYCYSIYLFIIQNLTAIKVSVFIGGSQWVDGFYG